MKIPYGRQSISEDDIQAVTDVLRSDRLTQGPDRLCMRDGAGHISEMGYGA